ncbi:MAG TPA: NAD-dependent epimerase/dehydratase family protein [Solirubrobacteraceae bacterium]|nr:NAD-dependent epimerase/dehydratase family protein [Solirubrobacteraceae bacterium]
MARIPAPGDFHVPHGRVLVTGCAGFIGSRLVERLLYDGTSVVGVDSLTDYYSRDLKKANLRRFRDHPGFSFRRLDLSREPLDGLLTDVDVVYHLAGQPGVRASFGSGFTKYLRHNIEASQRLLEAAIGQPLEAFVYASSSSVYGDLDSFPTAEDAPRCPRSPYGMTKLAVEELAAVYLRNHGIPVIGLRYFTVYGPGQRPDMAFARFIAQMLADQPLTVYGDGGQVRDFTYVDDAVRGTIAAAARGSAGAVYNIGGGHPISLRDAYEMLGEILERRVEVRSLPDVPGDVRRTGADGTLARRQLEFQPQISLRDGLSAQVKAVLRELPKARRRARRWATERD